MKGTLQILAIGALFMGAQIFAKDACETPCNEVLIDECKDLPAPCLEKLGSECSVEEQAPGACIKRTRVERYTDVYRIPPHYARNCVRCDENGCRPCDCCPLKCPCTPKCAPKCCPKHHHDCCK